MAGSLAGWLAGSLTKAGGGLSSQEKASGTDAVNTNAWEGGEGAEIRRRRRRIGGKLGGVSRVESGGTDQV